MSESVASHAQVAPSPSASTSSAPSGSTRPTSRTTQMKRNASQSGDFFTQEAALSPVQRHGGDPENANVHAAADHGISGGGGALPFAAQIQQSFGGYDISNMPMPFEGW